MDPVVVCMCEGGEDSAFLELRDPGCKLLWVPFPQKEPDPWRFS